jgi:MFS family permease
MSTPAQQDRTQLRRAVVSSFLGSVIEYYDFLLYATAAAVVFGQVFFSNLDPLAATVASFGTFTAGYLARPLGGIVFGHFGDRLGRKRMLILTMALMGVVSFWASFTNAGAPCGMVLSTAALTATAAVVGEDAFLAWGWRVPFLLSILLLAVGLFVRMKVQESPVFAAAQTERTTSAGMPLAQVLRRPKNLVLAVGVGFSAFVAQSTLTTFLIAYGVQAGYDRQTVLNGLTLSSALAIVGIVGWSALSDRVGRRPVVLTGSVVMAAFSFVLFPMVDSGSALLLTVALVLGQAVIHPMMYGPLAALFAELFSTRRRYTGASLGYQLSGIGAGVAPLFFAEIQRVTGGGGTVAISATVAAFCALTVVCILVLKETSRSTLSDRDPGATGDASWGRVVTKG